MKPKYVFNHVALFDGDTEEWKLYHKLDKRISKTVESYGNRYISKSKTLKNLIENPEKAREVGVNSWEIPPKFDIQIIRN